VDGFGENSLIVGDIIAVQLHQGALLPGQDQNGDLLSVMLLLGYISPRHYARIEETIGLTGIDVMRKR
jgi:hypothetical protein